MLYLRLYFLHFKHHKVMCNEPSTNVCCVNFCRTRTPSRINENIVILQLAHGTTCVVDLLHVFTKKFVHSIGWTMLIQSVKEAYRKNVAAKQRISGTGMSTNTPHNRQRHDSVDLKGIFEVEEVLVA